MQREEAQIQFMGVSYVTEGMWRKQGWGIVHGDSYKGKHWERNTDELDGSVYSRLLGNNTGGLHVCKARIPLSSHILHTTVLLYYSQ